MGSELLCYKLRRPWIGVLYIVIAENLETFIAQSKMEDQRGIPNYVEQEFRSYLECGIPAYGFIRVKCSEFKKWGIELHLIVKPHKNGCLCSKCLRKWKIIKRNKEIRSWMDITVFGIKIFLWYNHKDIKCPIHGSIQEDIPWAAPYARITYRLEYVILVYSQIMTQKAAARLLHIPQSTQSELLHRTIKRIRKDRKIRGLKTIGVDDISYCKGKKYATVVYDLDRCCVVWVGKGKGRETIDRFFKEKLSKHQLAQIEWASCDMSEAYIGAIEKFCPNVSLTNAVSEGINRIIRMVKNRASGFQNLLSFTDIISLTVGNVNIPEQIPEKFRTL